MRPPALGPLVAQGRTASVHAWRPGQVLKLFRAECDLATVEQEAHIARAVRAAGAPAPAVGEIVEVDGRFGMVFERVVGVPMSNVLMKQPWQAAALGQRLARLHAKVHRLRLRDALPANEVRLERQIKLARALPCQIRHSVLEALSTMPRDDCLCHGDFHPANVMLGVRGDIVVDWTDASPGHPMADVARTVIIVLGEAQRASGRSVAARPILRRFCNAYLAEYRRRANVTVPSFDIWRPIVAAARLGEGIDGLDSWLLAQALRISPTPKQ